jgi:hypothetical protein
VQNRNTRWLKLQLTVVVIFGHTLHLNHKLRGKLVKVVAADAEVSQSKTYLLFVCSDGCNNKLSQCNTTSTRVAKIVGRCYLAWIQGRIFVMCNWMELHYMVAQQCDIVAQLCPMPNRALVGTDRLVEGMVLAMGQCVLCRCLHELLHRISY